ncbi:MAG: pantetheine-phosphate adenylyltransferase [bacterium]
MNKPSKLKVGLTGNIGCGKSAVSQLLAAYPHVSLVDTDTLAKQIAALPEHAETITQLVGFSVDFSKSEDRKRLAEALFSNRQLLDAYQQFIHPLVWKKVDEQFNAMQYGLLVVESAILFEVQSECHYDTIIMVTCDESVQIDRLCNGNRAMQESDVRARMSLQIAQSIKKEKANFVIDNSGNEQQLEQHVLQLYNNLNQLIMKPEKTKALFVFSADPPTRGHEWLIKEALSRYDELAVAVTYNPAKKGDFTIEQRCDMVRAIVPAHVPVTTFSGIYSVDYAESIGAKYFIRGIRNAVDNEYEQMMAALNFEINPSVETIFIESPEELRDVSSSAVRLIVGPVGLECKGWEALVAKKVSPAVLIQIIAKHHDLFKNLQGMGAHGNETEFWTKIVTPYLERQRVHHGIGHAGDMIANFKLVRHLCENPTLVEFTIWLHDFYNLTMAGRHQNEERSGQVARELALELGLPLSFAEKADEMILATKHEKPTRDRDTQILLDLDLMVLGANERLFQKYEEGIRKEYDWVYDEQFYPRRLNILQTFMHRSHIYFTDYFRSRYEKQAKENLNRSIEQAKAIIEKFDS